MSSEGIRREVAWRLFAHEYNDSDMSFKEGDDERAPNYVVTPTGAKVNRLFVVGVVTEVDEVGDDYYRVRVSDPTATYMVYAGQYQPDAVSFFRDLDTPEFVSVVGKARTYKPDDSDDVYTSIRPEEVNTADEEIRDRWNLEAAQHTIDRAEAALAYLKGDGRAYESHRPALHDAEATVEHYDLDEDYLEDLRREAYQVVAELAGVDADLDDLEEVEVEQETADDAEPAGEAASETASPAQEAAGEGTVEPDPSSEPGSGESGASADAGADPEPSDAAADQPETEGTVEEPAVEAGAGGTEESADAGSEDAEAKDATGDADASFEEEFGDVDSEEAEWEWDEGERERVEEEFGGEFDTAAEIEDSGGADTTEGAGEPAEPEATEAVEESPSPDAAAAEPESSGETAEEEAGSADGSDDVDDLTAAEAGEVEEAGEAAGDVADEPADEPGSGDAAEDPESVVMEVIEEHGDGEGVARPEIRSLAADRGVDEESAEEALEQLLLEGMCYPSDGDRIKPL